MSATDDWGGVAVENQSKPDDWGGVPVTAPKIPDTSGMQKMAQQNLSAEDNEKAFNEIISKPIQTPQERLDAAAGMPVQKIIGGSAQPSDINAANRKQYVGAIKDGSAVDGGDWMQSALHAITPITRFMGHDPEYSSDYFAETGKAYVDSIKGAGGLLLYPFVSEESKKELLKGYDLNEDSSGVSGNINRALELEQATVGRAMGGLFAPVAAPISPILSPLIEGTSTIPQSAGVSSKWAQIPPKAIGAVMDVLGIVGGAHTATALKDARVAKQMGQQFPSGSGPWDNHPGADVIKDMIAKKQGIEPDEVMPEHIDQSIAEGSKNLFPAAQDFKAVETVTDGAMKEETLHTIYIETGVKPDQVFEDARNDPQVAQDVVDGKVPEVYEHLIEPKTFTSEQGEKLTIDRSDTDRAFNVVDENGDHVQGGFDSAEEARHYIEDKKFEAEERAAIEAEKESAKPAKDGEQTVLPGAEKITNRQLAERKMEGGKKPAVAQKAPDEGLFDTGAQKQTDLLDPNMVTHEVTIKSKPLSKDTVPPSEIGKPTSLSTFIKNNGGIKPSAVEGGDLLSAGHGDLLRKNGKNIDDMREMAEQHGYIPEGLSVPEFQEILQNTDGGREHFRQADADRISAAEDRRVKAQQEDSNYLEHEAEKVGIDTKKLPNETEKQYAKRLLKSLQDFYKNSEGAARVRSVAGEWLLKKPIETVQKWTGKLTGGIFQKIGEGYVRTFQPELMGDKARRADSYLAKFKTALQEAENTYYRQWRAEDKAWEKTSHDERMQWLYDHETGRWSVENDPAHAAEQAYYDAMYAAEKEAGVSPENYKENYLPHQWEKPEDVAAHFRSEAMIKKYGKDWFTKASIFDLIQEGVRAGFKLKTDNPVRMRLGRQLASYNMIATMDLLHDMEGSGIATPVKSFSVEKRIAKTERQILELKEKYKKDFEDIEKQKSLVDENDKPIGEPVSKKMQLVQKRLEVMESRLEDLNKEKSSNKLSPEQMKDLKGGFKVLGPDNKVWNIHQEAGPLWKNAMEMKGLWENQGLSGDIYRSYYAAKAAYVSVKLAASLFHPVHVLMIDLASDIAAPIHHLVQGGKITDLMTKESIPNFGLTKNTLGARDHPAIEAWNTPKEERTPQQQYLVTKMVEGGMKPTLSARDTVHFMDNLNKAISRIGLNNLRLLGTAIQLPGTAMKPFMEHWIPGMKAEIYDRATELALARDPSLKEDAGKRGEVFRQITKDIERTYGEMNQDVQFWNKTMRDSFNAAFISGGWKLAQLYNVKGLAQPLKIAGKFLKTGELNKADVTYNMIQAYTYTALTLATGAAILKVLGQPMAQAGDDAWDMVKNLVAPKTGEKNPDGTDIRLQQPAFAKEGYMLAKDINTEGMISGAGSFVYHATLIPGIMDTLNNKDFVGRSIISDPTDLYQWTNAGWDAISPIAISSYEKADDKNSDVGKAAQLLGFPLAGAYMNQTPFEQKVLHAYSEANPPKGDAYSAKLKSDLKSAVAKGDTEAAEETRERMREEGLTESQIHSAERQYTDKFVDYAWDKLPTQEQKRLIESASEEEKKNFHIKMQ